MSDVRERLQRLSPEKRALLVARLAREGSASKGVEAELPQLTPNPQDRFAPFPLTDLQRAYLLGRGDLFALGNLASRAYVELSCPPLDVVRLEAAWNRLVERHDMLRVVVSDEGEQRVLQRVELYRIRTRDVGDSESAEDVLRAVFEEMVWSSGPADIWPLFDVRVTRLRGDEARLHLCFDMLNVDGGSITILFRELTALYGGGECKEAPALAFRDYVLGERSLRETDGYRRARDYWLGRVDRFPAAPALPLACAPSAITTPRFVRTEVSLARDVSAKLRVEAARLGLTLNAVLLAAYGEVLAAWSAESRFVINVPLFNRVPLHPQVHDVVGPFASIELLEVDTTLPLPFAERAARVQAQLLEDLTHRQFDGVGVQRELARLRGPENAAMPVIFTSLLDLQFGATASKLGRMVRSINQTAQVWMDLHVDEVDGAIHIKWDAVDGLFPEGLVPVMLDRYRQVLANVAAGRAGEIRAGASMVPPAQRDRRAAANATEAPVPDLLAHDPIRKQAAIRPDHPAVIAAGRTLTFGELDRIANRIARHLQTSGVERGALVAVVMEKGWEQIPAALGVLKAGAAALPIDPTVPATRLHYHLTDGRVAHVLTQETLDRTLDWPQGVSRWPVDRLDEWAPADDRPPHVELASDDLAYVLYTSGSTGQPKGVMIEHRSIVNRMLDVIERFCIDPTDRVIGITALHHDISAIDIFAGLGAGATLVLPDAPLRRDPAHWAELINREQVTLWHSVPAFMEMLVEYLEARPEAQRVLPSLRQVCLGGDWIPLSLPDRIRAVAPDTAVAGIGGPTETTMCDICYRIGVIDPAWASVPYGAPMRNASYYVFDERLESRPDWAVGELYIGGVGLARGFWGDPARTAERFVTHPITGERLYRSGDLGRWRGDGTLEFMGRADFQVKIQGQRIELGEIEAALRRHSAVQASVVVVRTTRDGRRQLAAYYVAANGKAVEPRDLTRHAAAELPPHMIPQVWVPLGRLPLTANGKVDRRNLPDPPEPGRAMPSSSRSAGSTELTRKITDLVREALGIDEVDHSQSLLGYGANSLDLVRLGNRLEAAFGRRPRIDELFRMQSIDALVEYYVQLDDGAAIRPSAVSETAAIVASYRVLLDPDERDAFKNSQPGIRTDVTDRPSVRLQRPAFDRQSLEQLYAARRTQRTFSLKPIPFATFSEFLSSLAQLDVNGTRRYRYASPGGLYPSQVYLHVKPGRIEGVPAGVLYYHPREHRLVVITPGADVTRDIHIPFINQPVFDEAGFSLFIVVQLAAIAPGYGDRSLHFATLEAGLIAHLLETSARPNGIGLCQIGTVEFERVRPLFALDRSHVLTHSLVGGRLPEERPETVEGDSEQSAVARALAQVRELAPSEARALLEARRGAAGDGRT